MLRSITRPNDGRKLIQQINNMKIFHSQFYGKYQVQAPNGRILEEFRNLSSARQFARRGV